MPYLVERYDYAGNLVSRAEPCRIDGAHYQAHKAVYDSAEAQGMRDTRSAGLALAWAYSIDHFTVETRKVLGSETLRVVNLNPLPLKGNRETREPVRVSD